MLSQPPDTPFRTRQSTVSHLEIHAVLCNAVLNKENLATRRVGLVAAELGGLLLERCAGGIGKSVQDRGGVLLKSRGGLRSSHVSRTAFTAPGSVAFAAALRRRPRTLDNLGRVGRVR